MKGFEINQKTTKLARLVNAVSHHVHATFDFNWPSWALNILFDSYIVGDDDDVHDLVMIGISTNAFEIVVLATRHFKMTTRPDHVHHAFICERLYMNA